MRWRRTFIVLSFGTSFQDRSVYKTNSDRYIYHPAVTMLTSFGRLPFRCQLALRPSQSVAIERAHWTMARKLKIEDCDGSLKKIPAPTSPSPSPPPLLFSLSLPLPASLDGDDQTASVDRIMVAHYAIPPQPLVHGQSKVSHKLQLSQQERTKLRLAIFAFFIASLTGIFLFVNIVSSPEEFPASRDEYRSRGASGSDRMKSLSASWASYSPYHPAADFDGSTREGCVVSQVNIVSSPFGFLPASIISPSIYFIASRLAAFRSFNATVPDTQLPE